MTTFDMQSILDRVIEHYQHTEAKVVCRIHKEPTCVVGYAYEAGKISEAEWQYAYRELDDYQLGLVNGIVTGCYYFHNALAFAGYHEESLDVIGLLKDWSNRPKARPPLRPSVLFQRAIDKGYYNPLFKGNSEVGSEASSYMCVSLDDMVSGGIINEVDAHFATREIAEYIYTLDSHLDGFPVEHGLDRVLASCNLRSTGEDRLAIYKNWIERPYPNHHINPPSVFGMAVGGGYYQPQHTSMVSAVRRLNKVGMINKHSTVSALKALVFYWELGLEIEEGEIPYDELEQFLSEEEGRYTPEELSDIYSDWYLRPYIHWRGSNAFSG